MFINFRKQTLFIILFKFLFITNTMAMLSFEDEDLGKDRVVVLCCQKFPCHKFIDVPVEDRVLCVDKKALHNDDLNFLGAHYSKIYVIENYFGGEIESIISREHSTKPFTRLIAMDEFDLIRAGRIRDAFNIPGQNYKSACAFRDKILMKELAQNAGLSTPRFAPLTTPVDIITFKKKVGFPFVVKPARDASSRGITIIRGDDQLEKFISNLSGSYLIENQFILEEFINGRVYHIDGIVNDGEIQVTWPSVYINSGLSMVADKSLFGWHLLDNENPLTSRLNTFAHEIIKALPTSDDTVFHLETFVDEQGKIYLCEIASRAGGAGIREDWIRSFDIDLVGDFVRLQCGKYNRKANKDLTKLPNCITGWVFFPKTIGQVKKIGLDPKFEWLISYNVNVAIGDKLEDPTQMTDTICRGQIIAKSEDEFLKHMQSFKAWVDINFTLEKSN